MEQYIPKSAVVAEIKRRRGAALMRQQNLEAIGQETTLNEMVAFELNRIISFIDTLEVKEVQEEPVSKDLKEFEVEYIEREKDNIVCVYDRHAGLVDGAKWQKEQFEKNRLAACDRQTEEEAEIERDFVMGIIEKEHRQPTFDDAIKYGMKKMKEQMMKNTADAIIGLPYENKDGGYTHLIDVSRPLPVGSNKIAIIFKED